MINNSFEIVYVLNPHVKLIWLISCAFLFFTTNILLILLIVTVSAIMFVLSGAHRTIYMKGFIYISAFFASILLLAIFVSGHQGDLILAIISISKWTGIVLSSMAFFAMTRPFELMVALRSFKVPEGFVFALGIGFRFVPVVFDQIEKISMAQRARGLRLRNGLGRLTGIPIVIRALVVPLVIEILRRSWDTWLALNVRGFSLAKRRRQTAHETSMQDLLVLSYSIGVIVASLIL